jgi:hypothetical protein
MKLTSKEKTLFFAVIFFLLFSVGGILNMSVIGNNGCKMPVYTGEYLISDNNHFIFTNPKEVNQFLLTDIIPIFNSINSIGDVLMLIGVIGFISSLVVFWKLKIKEK